MIKKLFGTTLLVITYCIAGYNHSEAAIRSINGNEAIKGSSSDEKSCWAKGYRIRKCKYDMGPSNQCKQNNEIYYKLCSCDDSKYTYNSTNCPFPKKLEDLSDCGSGKYKTCECSKNYNLTEEDCKKKEMIQGLTCDSKSVFCDCPSDYKTCSKNKVGVGKSCIDEYLLGLSLNLDDYKKYKNCECESKFKVCDDNGPEAYSEKCTEDDGTVKYEKCKVPAKACNLINSEYKETVPSGYKCTKIVSEGATCYKDCSPLTCVDGGFKSSIPANESCSTIKYEGKTCYNNCTDKCSILIKTIKDAKKGDTITLKENTLCENKKIEIPSEINLNGDGKKITFISNGTIHGGIILKGSNNLENLKIDFISKKDVFFISGAISLEGSDIKIKDINISIDLASAKMPKTSSRSFKAIEVKKDSNSKITGNIDISIKDHINICDFSGPGVMYIPELVGLDVYYDSLIDIDKANINIKMDGCNTSGIYASSNSSINIKNSKVNVDIVGENAVGIMNEIKSTDSTFNINIDAKKNNKEYYSYGMFENSLFSRNKFNNSIININIKGTQAAVGYNNQYDMSNSKMNIYVDTNGSYNVGMEANHSYLRKDSVINIVSKGEKSRVLKMGHLEFFDNAQMNILVSGNDSILARKIHPIKGILDMNNNSKFNGWIKGDNAKGFTASLDIKDKAILNLKVESANNTYCYQGTDTGDEFKLTSTEAVNMICPNIDIDLPVGIGMRTIINSKINSSKALYTGIKDDFSYTLLKIFSEDTSKKLTKMPSDFDNVYKTGIFVK